ncbi:hypothetical protein Golax_009123 [Gossypium laxum]|uniref:Uncharacterized protein n=1 Tax=Gossypium laxum TaxID=34288 RepID=A0A7J9ADL4_9ROSI|nr:hypothetical protein [Gossypium laxum]MBA0721600.1 hypothetical protein [Gossypium laxum]
MEVEYRHTILELETSRKIETKNLCNY